MITIVSVVLLLLASFLGIIIEGVNSKLNRLQALDYPTHVRYWGLQSRGDAKNGAKIIFSIFALIIVIYFLLCAIIYWDKIVLSTDNMILCVWMFIFMIIGMFVQVISSNHHSGKSIFAIEAGDILYPLLFSVIVYYPTYLIGLSSSNKAFSLYAACINGYFWQSIVTNVKPIISRNNKN